MVLYKHENNKDVAFEILKYKYSDHKRIKLKVVWWNLAHKPHFCMNLTQNLNILQDDWPKWKRITLKESEILEETN